MKKKAKGCLITVLILFLIAGVWWWNFTRPHLYKQATSPDGSWSVQVHRRHTFPYLEGVDVIVTATRQDGTVLFHDVIDNRDIWQDVDEQYRDVICENDEIRLGPEYWDGTNHTYFVIKKGSFEQSSRLVPK
jgi:hypothetical protein